MVIMWRKGGSGMKTNFLYGAFILCQLPFSFFW